MEYYDMDWSTAYFQHDGDPKHRSKSTIQWLNTNGVNYIDDWPEIFGTYNMKTSDVGWTEMNNKIINKDIINDQTRHGQLKVLILTLLSIFGII
ncbi:hypothetical protein G6F40_013840 [Rhizopus arrhizus]|nr:hypothetical protein G6F20_013556 [Rhizopus arrhizus]KAG1086900.1 hypothetical protein G6F40_013840 [Rhizopus arrhizus]